ncbi:TetR/AcrR family transcriptional regulator [Naasia lichenicola]|uniref:TetR family transcriptional regulator n=1 Tax=Naasia lichenicola TaxID=2565933 RepID=A0A4S4FRT0_9MICO|nr:TetR/AcrR family transcriptional regulator [Naasia lichenicola]THG33379.1 TetR family transcriptional regulator [Naasia lichenicola]
MGRWEPDSKGRLQAAALELFVEHGYEQTTVADIAARSGVTERTFFRYFADKREVLFEGTAVLQATVVEHIASAAMDLTALEIVGEAMAATGEIIGQRREYSQLRQTAIAANASLQERELLKLAALAAAAAHALRDRGVGEPTASLAAEAGVAVFKIGFERWIADEPTGSGEPVDIPSSLGDSIRSALLTLRSIAAA